MPHESQLLVSLGIVSLVDGEGVNPQHAWSASEAKTGQGRVEVRCHGYGPIVDFDIMQGLEAAPAVRKGLIRRRIPQLRDFDESTADR